MGESFAEELPEDDTKAVAESRAVALTVSDGESVARDDAVGVRVCETDTVLQGDDEPEFDCIQDAEDAGDLDGDSDDVVQTEPESEALLETLPLTELVRVDATVADSEESKLCDESVEPVPELVRDDDAEKDAETVGDVVGCGLAETRSEVLPCADTLNVLELPLDALTLLDTDGEPVVNEEREGDFDDDALAEFDREWSDDDVRAGEFVTYDEADSDRVCAPEDDGLRDIVLEPDVDRERDGETLSLLLPEGDSEPDADSSAGVDDA